MHCLRDALANRRAEHRLPRRAGHELPYWDTFCFFVNRAGGAWDLEGPLAVWPAAPRGRKRCSYEAAARTTAAIFLSLRAQAHHLAARRSNSRRLAAPQAFCGEFPVHWWSHRLLRGKTGQGGRLSTNGTPATL